MRKILFLLLLCFNSVHSQYVKVTAKNELEYEDYILIGFDSSATDSMDFDYDGIKFPSQNQFPTIYSIENVTNNWLSINTLKPIFEKVKMVDFNVLNGYGDTINLKFIGFKNLNSYCVLWDKKLNTYQIITSDSTYDYVTNQFDTLNFRFQILFHPKPIVHIDRANCIYNKNILKLAITDSLSPDLMFNIYNTGLSINETGHFGYYQPITMNLPSGQYYLKLGFIAPPFNTYLNGWVKTYYFVLDSIPNININLDISSQTVFIDQTFYFTATFSPNNSIATANLGDGTYFFINNGQTYTHMYNTADVYDLEITVLDTISECKEAKNIKIFVTSNQVNNLEMKNANVFFGVVGSLIIICNNNLNGLLNIYDISGRLIITTNIQLIKNNPFIFHNINISNGVYVLEFLIDKKKFYKKVLKNN